MSTTLQRPHIRFDEAGRPWIEDANIKVVEVVADYLAHGSSVEEMALQLPHLTPAQIHAALSCYYDHQAEFDAELMESRAQADKLRTASLDSPMRRKLRFLGKIV